MKRFLVYFITFAVVAGLSFIMGVRYGEYKVLKTKQIELKTLKGNGIILKIHSKAEGVKLKEVKNNGDGK